MNESTIDIISIVRFVLIASFIVTFGGLYLGYGVRFYHWVINKIRRYNKVAVVDGEK